LIVDKLSSFTSVARSYAPDYETKSSEGKEEHQPPPEHALEWTSIKVLTLLIRVLSPFSVTGKGN